MKTEFDILIAMHSELTHQLTILEHSWNKMTELRKSITQLNNDYFETKCNDPLFGYYLSVFDNTSSYTELVNNLNMLKMQLETNLKTMCNHHQWVHDMIDITPDKSKQICYCIKCNITQKG